jgi:hypothetical protein
MNNKIVEKSLNITNELKRKRRKEEKKEEKKELYIPKPEEYELIKTKNYKVLELKKICKKYNLKVTGKKEELKDRIYDYLYKYNPATIIEKITRGYLTRKYFKLKGETLYKRELCVNETDFLTLENIKEIPHYQYYSLKQNNCNYGFNIISLNNLIKRSNNKDLYNPYNRLLINKEEIEKIKEIINYTMFMKYPIELEIEEEKKELSIQEKLKLRIYKIFEKIDELGNYSNAEWLLELNKTKLLKLIKEIHEIWYYRITITQETKRSINHPYGNPFRNINIHTLFTLNSLDLLEIVIILLEELLFKCINDEYASLGAIYILSALTLVNKNCADALPWLYESAIYIV